MINEPNNVIISNDSNVNSQTKKIITPNVVDFSNIKESENNNNNNEGKKSSRINSFAINTFKKDDWNKPIKIYSKEEILNNMNIIFLNYSTYSFSKKLNLISIENIIKILKNIGFLPELIKLYQIDILIKKVCPKIKYIIFEDFMNIFIKIAQKIFPKEYRTNKDLLLNHFFHSIFSLYEIILVEETVPLKALLKYPYSSIISVMNIIPDDSQILVLNSLLYTLNEIYERYFIYNVNINPGFDKNRSLSNLFDFCKDFEITPFILNNETQIMTYFNAIIGKKEIFKLIDDSNEKKNTFTFNNFIIFFIHLSEYNYAKVFQNFEEDDKNVTKLSKLIMLLTKLECSKGMRHIINSSLPNLSLMPNKELLLKYNFIFKKESDSFDNFLGDNSKIEEEKIINNGSPDNLNENIKEEKS